MDFSTVYYVFVAGFMIKLTIRKLLEYNLFRLVT